MAIEPVTAPSDGKPKKPTKQRILQDFKNDMKSADTLRLEIVSAVETWRDHYNGLPYGNEQEGKSKIVSRDIKRQDEWQHASVKDPFVSDPDIVKCGPVTHEDRAAAEQNQLVLNHQFCRQFPRYKFMTDVIKLFYKEGSVIVKCDWQYEDEEIEVPMPIWGMDNAGNVIPVGEKMVKKLKVIKNQPGAKVCRIEDIYLDPTCEGDLDKAQFVIHRYETDLSTLRKTKKYKNLNKLAAAVAGSDAPTTGDTDYDPQDETNFKFGDIARKKIVIHEYWGNYDIRGNGIAEPVVCTWSEDIIIQLESNPYPEKDLPFLIVANNSTPFELYGEAAAELVGDNQKLNTAIKRGIIDNMANSNNAQKGVRTGSLDPLNKKRFLNGKNFEYNGSQADFYEGGYNAIPQTVFQVMEQNNNETESMLGVKAFSGGIAGASLGSTAKAAGGVLDAVSVRRLDIVRNLAENLIKPLMRKWTSYNSQFLDEVSIVRITNDEFVEVKRDDLTGAIDIEIQVSTSEDNAAKGQDLSFVMQTMGPEMDPEMKKIIMSELFKLKRLPDLAKKIEEYQPQPDPFTEKMKMLELRKVISEIKERESRTVENQADLIKKKTEADLNVAKTRELDGKSDLNDLDFTRKADGTDFEEDMQKEAFKHGSTMAQKKEDAKNKPTKTQ
jgi:hypothetical protein